MLDADIVVTAAPDSSPSARPLRRWLALRIALVATLPLAMVATLAFWALLPQLRTDIEIHHQALARASVGQIEAYLHGATHELRTVAEHFRNLDYQPAPSWFGPLDAHTGIGDVFAAIYIVDAGSVVHAVGLPEALRDQRDHLLGLDLSRQAVLREARERNETVWSEIFLSPVSGRLAVALAIPVAEYVLAGEIAIDRLSAFISRLPPGNGMFQMIADRQGQVIAHSRPAPSSQPVNLSHLPLVRAALQERLATGRFELDGEALAGAAAQVPEPGWIVLVAEPYVQAFQAFLSTLWVLAAGALMALLAAIIAAVMLAHDFSERIRPYTAQAHAIADGDYNQPWPASDIREFASLGDDLRRMALAIRQRERDFTASEARYRSVIANAPVAIFQFDAEGDLTLNEGKGLARAGLAPGAGVGHSILRLYRNYPQVCEYVRRAIAGESLRFTAEIRNTVYEVFFSPIQDGADPVQVMGMAVDITERQRAEAELQQHRGRLEELVAERTAELQQANAELHQQQRVAKLVTEVLRKANTELRQAMTQLVQAEKLAALGHLVAGVAHELNTPLGNARVVASTLGEELRTFAAAVESGALRRSQVENFLNRGREAVELLERNTARAADLIGHFKQVATDQTSMRRRRFHLRETIEEILVALRPQFKHAAHQIVLDIPAELELDSYPGPLEQVIAHLVSNSLQHGFAGIEAGIIHIRAAPLGSNQIQIDYQDDGVGIPPATLNRIFEPFFTTRLGQGGSGLGLYIVYTLITGALGGKIEARSEPGQGAKFAIELPLTAPLVSPSGETS